MNNLEFYNKLAKFESLQHAAQEKNKYFIKLDNYYPDKSARYFYTKAEWEAYQEGLKRTKWEKEQKAKKEAENRSGMTGYNTWKKNQNEQKQAKESQANKLKDITDPAKIAANEVYRKNMGASQSENERETNRRSGESEYNKKKGVEYTNYQKQKAASEAEQDRLKAKKEAEEKNAEIEKIKYQGKKKLYEKQEKDKKEREMIEEAKKKGQKALEDSKRMEEAKKKGEEALRKAKADLELEEAKKKGQKALEDAKRMEEAKKKGAMALDEAKRNQEIGKLENLRVWKNNTKKEVSDLINEIGENLDKCADDRDNAFTLDNDMVQYFKEELKREDPDFDGDLAAYVRPYLWGSSDDTHMSNANKALNHLQKRINQEIDETTVEDNLYSSYLDTLKDKKEANKNKTINNQMAKARLALSKMYQGEDDKFDIDYRLRYVIDKKIKELDDDYKGNIYKYVKPSLLGLKKDNDAYNIVKKVIDEVEQELKSAEQNGKYDDFLNSISKVSIY